MKFRDWFSIKAVRVEMKKVTWLTKKELLMNTLTVLAFCLVLGVFFVASDAIIAVILRMLGLS